MINELGACKDDCNGYYTCTHVPTICIGMNDDLQIRFFSQYYHVLLQLLYTM